MRSRKSSIHYQTFPTSPPLSRGAPPENSFSTCNLSSSSVDSFSDGNRNGYKADRGGNWTASDGGDDGEAGEGWECSSSDGYNSIPKRQLFVLGVISLVEQTALNSISPYLPEMTGTFPEVNHRKVGLYVGIVASSFSAAQFATNFFWGRLSDRIGRKPVVLFGTLMTAALFIAFGVCRTLWQAIMVQAAIGLVNGNAGIVPTILGEITNRSNQSSAFKYLPVVYGIGGITGPLIGGVLVHPVTGKPTGPVSRVFAEYPYLLPNVLAASTLFLDFFFIILFLDESLKEAKKLPPLGTRIKKLLIWLWEFASGSQPSYIQVPQNRDNGPEEAERQSPGDTTGGSGPPSPPVVFPTAPAPVPYSSILTLPVIIFLITYSIFNLLNASFNSLYPIFISSPPPTGRGLSPKEIGISLSLAGVITIFQIFLFGPLEIRVGKLWGYRFSLGAFAIAFWAMPFVGYVDSEHPQISKVWLWLEVGGILLLKTAASVVGLTCAMIVTTHASPKPSALGTLNGLAQMLGAGGRAVGPLLSGGVFTLSMTLSVGMKGLLAWGMFGTLAVVGLGLSLWGIGNKRSPDEEGGREGEEGEEEELL